MEETSNACQRLQPILTRVQEPRSAPVDMDWDKYTASVDVLHEQPRANTIPLQAGSHRPILTSISTGNQAISSPENIKPKTVDCEDRWRIDPLEYRKGYYYSVEMPAQACEQENLTPRRVLDQQGSNDFSGYLQDTAGSPILSPDLCMVSSPFAAATAQPFNDSASCRSRLSDYGYDTVSEDGDEGDDGEQGAELYEGVESPDAAAAAAVNGKAGAPFEDCGFWAEVGAAESHQSPVDSQATSCNTHFTEPHVPHQPTKWEVNEWDSASERGARRRLVFDDFEEPEEDAGEEPEQEDGGHLIAYDGSQPAQRKARDVTVLLPWDMD